MREMNDSVRARVNLFLATALAFAFGLGLASALDLTPVTIAADGRESADWVVGASAGADVTLNGGFAEVVERVAPAVVTVHAVGERAVPTAQIPFRFPPGFDQPQDERAEPPTQLARWSGSGFIISEDGYVITNNHVVESADRLDVELSDRRRFDDVEVVGRDPQTDVALLKIEADGLTGLPIGSSEETRVGEWVLAVGSPGFSGARQGRLTLETTVTAGIVSAKGRGIGILAERNPLAIEDFVQTDAVINRGNSGGPLVNAAGEVIGINTAILSETAAYQGYGFAVPIELAREVVDDLIEFGEVRRALIGVSITDVTSSDARYYDLDRVAGVVVGSFSFEESPARTAGMEVGDVIVGIEGQPVDGVSDLQRRIRSFEPGETVTLDVIRRATREPDRVRVRLMAADESQPRVATRDGGDREPGSDDPLGIEVVDAADLGTAERRTLGVPDDLEGVVVVDGDRRGAVGHAFGVIPAGIVISDINGQEIASVEDYERAVSGLEPGDAVSLVYLRPVSPETWDTAVVSLVIPQR